MGAPASLTSLENSRRPPCACRVLSPHAPVKNGWKERSQTRQIPLRHFLTAVFWTTSRAASKMH